MLETWVGKPHSGVWRGHSAVSSIRPMHFRAALHHRDILVQFLESVGFGDALALVKRFR